MIDGGSKFQKMTHLNLRICPKWPLLISSLAQNDPPQSLHVVQPFTSLDPLPPEQGLTGPRTPHRAPIWKVALWPTRRPEGKIRGAGSCVAARTSSSGGILVFWWCFGVLVVFWCSDDLVLMCSDLVQSDLFWCVLMVPNDFPCLESSYYMILSLTCNSLHRLVFF